MTLIRETISGTALKPTKQSLIKMGISTPKIEIKANSPIKANRWNALNATGKITNEGSPQLRLRSNFAVHWLSKRIPVLMRWLRYQVTLRHSKHTLTVAQCDLHLSRRANEGWVCASDTNRQGYQVNRAFGYSLDSFELDASDDIVNLSVKTSTQTLRYSTPRRM